MNTTTTLLQAVIAVLQWGNVDLASVFSQFGINTREGMVMTRVVTWIRSYKTGPYVKKDIKGRLLVAQKYWTQISWGIEGSKLRVFPGIIQINVLKARGKKGGWLINIHKQTPLLSQKTMKFVFCNRWEGYWASDELLKAGLMVRMDKGIRRSRNKPRPGSAARIEKFVSIRQKRDILNNIKLLKKESKKSR
jgi:hypothetical protein